MFDFGFSEILLIVVVAVLFIGPKELPVVMAQVGRVFRRLNYMRYAITAQMDEFMREAGVEDLRNEVNFEASSVVPDDAVSPAAAHDAAIAVIEKPAAKPKKPKAVSKAKKAAVKKVAAKKKPAVKKTPAKKKVKPNA